MLLKNECENYQLSICQEPVVIEWALGKLESWAPDSWAPIVQGQTFRGPICLEPQKIMINKMISIMHEHAHAEAAGGAEAARGIAQLAALQGASWSSIVCCCVMQCAIETCIAFCAVLCLTACVQTGSVQSVLFVYHLYCLHCLYCLYINCIACMLIVLLVYCLYCLYIICIVCIVCIVCVLFVLFVYYLYCLHCLYCLYIICIVCILFVLFVY